MNGALHALANLLLPLMVILGYLGGLFLLLFISLSGGIQTLVLAGILHALHAIWWDNSHA